MTNVVPQEVLEHTTLEKETKMLQLFRDNYTTNPKKLLKFAKKIWPTQSKFLQEGILRNLFEAKDPVDYLNKCLQQAEEYPVIIKQLVADGKHGFMVRKGVIYPIEIKARDNWLKANDRWTVEDEDEIMDKWVKAWMKENNVRDFQARVMLFAEFGFSGIMKLVTL